jgi:hypothetical protein
MFATFFRIRSSALISLPALTLLVTSPLFAEDCLDCHSDVAVRMRGGSHHVQQTGVNATHCYACHWEARPDGGIDKQYHTGTSAKNGARAVDLVVWGAGQRPIEYKNGITAISYNPSEIATAQERSAVGGITRHCLGCHSDQNATTLPFSGDPNSPSRYSWDGLSVASRYSATGTTTWGKYSTSASNKKMRIAKAFSAHGNASANQGGWSSASGYDGEIPLTRGGSGASNVECFDCHNSHGSDIPGVTTSYRSLDGSNRGGILKQTNSGKSGYRMSYTPSANPDQTSSNPYNPGAGLCFDCHETAQSGATPWGYNSTYGAKEPIIGYKDTFHFGTGVKGSTSRYANRQSRTEIVSSHLKGGKFLSYSTQGRINGLCTPCHDPHGVSRTLGDRMAYAVPLLKGTWLTSPYREDGPPSASPGKAGKGLSSAVRKTDYNTVNREANSNFGKDGSASPRQGEFNAVNREASSNFGKGGSSAARQTDYNTVNREANSNFGKDGSASPRQGEFNAVNREASSNFGKGGSSAARQTDYNTVNREANSNFGKDGSASPRQGEFNAVNREASSNFGKGGSSTARQTDYNTVNREANSNFGKDSSASPRQGEFNAVQREASSNFGKGLSSAALQTDYNTVNREANSNFGKDGSALPRQGEFNAVNREASSNFGKVAKASREMDSNLTNRGAGANFGRGSSAAPREPMAGMQYNVDRNTFGGDNRITESADLFAGICLSCHTKESFAVDSKANLVHRAVKGLGNNKEHSFPCSKCHQSHNSGLPRLMQTNCFQDGPTGLRENSGVPWLPFSAEATGNKGSETSPGQNGSSSKNKVVGCHVRQFGKAAPQATKSGDSGEWNKVTTW